MADDLEELKKKKMQQKAGSDAAGAVAGGADAQEQQKEQMRQQLKKIASEIMTKEARSRLGNIRAADEDTAAKIELQLVQLYKAGQIRDKITDDQLKEILKKIKEAEDESSMNIKHR